MANLCISPVHAGIMPFSTANSSFIFDRRRRSIKLCAVFLAIFRPAALVADGCFFLDADPASFAAGTALLAAAVLLPEAFPLVAVVVVVAGDGAASAAFLSSCCSRGFIWMILRDLVGGGGSAKAFSLSLEDEAWAAEDRLRDLTVSAGCIGYGALGDVVETGDSGLKVAIECEEPAEFGLLMAGSGNSKDICIDDSCLVPSFPWMSVEEAGVGGNAVRGMIMSFCRGEGGGC